MKKILTLLILLLSVNCYAVEKDVIADFDEFIFISEFNTIPGYEVVKRTQWIIDQYSFGDSSLEYAENDHRKRRNLFSLEMYLSSRIEIRSPVSGCYQSAIRIVSQHCKECNAILNLRCTVGYKRIKKNVLNVEDREFEAKVVILYGEPVVVRKVK